MIYTFLVIDFDKTYDIEDEDEIGTAPSVYMVYGAFLFFKVRGHIYNFKVYQLTSNI